MEPIELDIGGMTCASCAARIEKRLNRIDGVAASVNYATEKATVHARPQVSTQDLMDAVQKIGYTASVPRVEAERTEPSQRDETRTRLLVSIALSVPVIALSMITPLRFTYWQWVSLALATPVVVWGGLPFHRAALANLRHGAATMDTLISIGTLAAFGWSVYALFLDTAGDSIYLEVASGVTTFILAGRYFEARAKRFW